MYKNENKKKMTQGMIAGRIVRDGVLREANIGGAKVPVVDVTIASDEGFGDRKRTTFWRLSIWRDAAVKLVDSIKKGRIVSAHGTIDVSVYQRQDKSYAAQLLLKNAVMTFLDARPTDPAITADMAAGQVTADEPEEAEAPEETPFA